MHHVREDNVSSVFPSKHGLRSEYHGLRGILDMAFLEDRGIYDCDLNAENITVLYDILMNFAKRL